MMVNVSVIIKILVLLLAFVGFAEPQRRGKPGSSAAAAAPSGSYVADPSQCDAYTHYKPDGTAENEVCPDGLVFNDKSNEYPRYPCGYPAEVDCGNRRGLQPAQPGSDPRACPRQYGLYRSSSCSEFTSCTAGEPITHACPEGLAFNEDLARCDWPDQVPGCEAMLRAQCPAPRAAGPDEQQEDFSRLPDPEDCRKFYVCVNGTPRLQGCGLGEVFNEETGSCVDVLEAPGGKCANYYPQEVLNALQVLRNHNYKF